MIDLKEALKFSKKTILKAGKFLLNKQQGVKIKAYKNKVDIVTNFDVQVEKLIISAIEKKYPNHNIISEEKGSINKKGKYTWYLDPLDGTKEYYRKIPAYNTSLCLFFKKNPLLSLVYIPYSNQLFSATDKIGAFLNERKIRVNNEKNLSKSIIYFAPPCYGKVSNNLFKSNFKRIENITKKVYRARFSPNQNSYLCFLALGSIEAYLNISHPIKAIEDAMPALFIAKMAGAKITDLKGNGLDFSKAKQLYIASNAKMHEQILKIINE